MNRKNAWAVYLNTGRNFLDSCDTQRLIEIRTDSLENVKKIGERAVDDYIKIYSSVIPPWKNITYDIIPILLNKEEI
jgi:hypothetical protein